MAGTDGREAVPADPLAPGIVLIRPQLGENIGTAARAMLNCGLTDLRLVEPRDGWPNPRAEAASSGADQVIGSARLYPSAAEAVADARHVYASTARARDLLKPVVTAEEAGRRIRAAAARGERSVVLFGPERTGLENDDLGLAHAVLSVPLNPGYRSLNLAQAVLLISYCWFHAGSEEPAVVMPELGRRPATNAELQNLFEHLEQELDASGFLRHEQMRPTMVKNIRAMFMRAQLTDQEVRTFHGMITALSGRRKGGDRAGPRRDEEE